MKGILTHLQEKFASTALPVESALSPESSGNNVLVVDDDNAVCRIVQRMLSDEQYQVQTSQSVAILGVVTRIHYADGYSIRRSGRASREN